MDGRREGRQKGGRKWGEGKKGGKESGWLISRCPRPLLEHQLLLINSHIGDTKTDHVVEPVPKSWPAETVGIFVLSHKLLGQFTTSQYPEQISFLYYRRNSPCCCFYETFEKVKNQCIWFFFILWECVGMGLSCCMYEGQRVCRNWFSPSTMRGLGDWL